MRQDSDEKPLDEQIENLQETISKLIVENENLEVKLTNLTFESNDVISYLKKLVEEKDDEIARLENMLETQKLADERKFRDYRQNYENEEKKLKEEIDRLNSEMRIMDTQLGNQHRIGLEIIEMSTKFSELKKVVNDQEEIIRRKEAEERSVRIAAIEQARADLSNEYEQAVAEIRAEAMLENKGHTLMNNQVIEHLELELEKKKIEIARLQQNLEEKEKEVEEEVERTNEKDEENAKLRRLLEKSGQTTEKALRDSKRRLEESESKKKQILEKYLLIETDLKNKLDEATNTMEEAKKNSASLEDQLLKEQETRKVTIDAHKTQNQKIEELRTFFKDVLSGEEGLVEEVIKENRNSVFAHLALIVSRIPIVR
ncbi:unnamed protein product [Caenorhabditis angaria]|uniref:Uncharacterized protein n=1 Tax=Caenorhabditis angaria TaxID=860376 RepID=A0A9P1IXD5_9PELO|nr:unnamed protein product [Caenorhabditis angaria]